MKTQSCSTHKQTLFEKYFSDLKDPRRTNQGNFRHTLNAILIVTISAILCGADSWELVILFGNNQLSWLKKYGDFTNGIPSQDTFERVFAAINPKSFNTCFINWIESIRKKIPGQVVAVDGKSIRGANPKSKTGSMPHIVSVFAVANGLCLGQIKVDDKSNEITAIPELLELLAIEGTIITIDAIGTQEKIASKIKKNNADYILAVKGNQGLLERAVKDTVLLEKPVEKQRQVDCGHGRVERRTCYVYDELSHIEKWAGLKTIVKIKSEIYNKTSGKTRNEERFYISSLPANAERLNEAIRSHWAIENNLHWTLDVTFGEDSSRKRTKNAAENFNIILKMALTLLVNDKSNKLSKKSKRMKAALDLKYRENLLNS